MSRKLNALISISPGSKFKEERRVSKLEKRLHRMKKLGKPFNANAHLILRQKQLALRATPHEVRMSRLLEDMAERYHFQRGFIAGGVMYIADFYLPERRLVIEVDGYSHETVAGRMRDAARDSYFKSRALRVLHIKNEEVQGISKSKLLKRLDGASVV